MTDFLNYSMIPLIPYKSIVITTSLPLNDAVTVLFKAVSPKKRWYQFSLSRSGKFEGTVSREGFKIERAINYRNSFLPILHGTFRPDVTGTRIEVTMKMHPFVLLFSVFWFGAVLSGFVLGIIGSFASDHIPFEVLIGAGTMLVAFYLMTILGFGFEAKKAIRFMNETFKQV